jgi:hypothetical protein
MNEARGRNFILVSCWRSTSISHRAQCPFINPPTMENVSSATNPRKSEIRPRNSNYPTERSSRLPLFSIPSADSRSPARGVGTLTEQSLTQPIQTLTSPIHLASRTLSQARSRSQPISRAFGVFSQSRLGRSLVPKRGRMGKIDGLGEERGR